MHDRRQWSATSFRHEAELGAWWALGSQPATVAVTEARHWYAGQRGPDAESLLHAWLLFDHAVPIGVRGRGDRFLLATEDPYGSYDMGQYGQTEVGPAQHPDVLARFVGARLTDGAVIVGHHGEDSCGLVLRFDTGDLTIATLADEWILAAGTPPAALTRHSIVGPFVHGTPPCTDLPPSGRATCRVLPSRSVAGLGPAGFPNYRVEGV
ncbi:hypothetical protein ACFFMR_00135 [Micromonospora andamanensis]|uniref:hypothetical protein n=1 Tax=Micromonospora andamanensis TaxID=1287068 RepID=UPI0019525BB0|nr:hypothetical protein [Micromonospora andamanensis]